MPPVRAIATGCSGTASWPIPRRRSSSSEIPWRGTTSPRRRPPRSPTSCRCCARSPRLAERRSDPAPSGSVRDRRTPADAGGRRGTWHTRRSEGALRRRRGRDGGHERGVRPARRARGPLRPLDRQSRADRRVGVRRRVGDAARARALRRPRLRAAAAAGRRGLRRHRPAVVRRGHRAVGVRRRSGAARRQRRHDRAVGPPSDRAGVPWQPRRAPRRVLRGLPRRVRVRPADRRLPDGDRRCPVAVLRARHRRGAQLVLAAQRRRRRTRALVACRWPAATAASCAASAPRGASIAADARRGVVPLLRRRVRAIVGDLPRLRAARRRW